MHRVSKVTAALVAATAMGLSACEDVPFVPRWDADWVVPLPSQTIRLPNYFPLAIPPGFEAPVSFDQDLPLSLDASIGDLLEQSLDTASVTLELQYNLQMSGQDTLYVDRLRANLGNAAAARIVFPITFSGFSARDTLRISPAAIRMISETAAAQDTLWVRFSGQMRYDGSSPHTVSSSDTIAVRAQILARVRISR